MMPPTTTSYASQASIKHRFDPRSQAPPTASTELHFLLSVDPSATAPACSRTRRYHPIAKSHPDSICACSATAARTHAATSDTPFHHPAISNFQGWLERIPLRNRRPLVGNQQHSIIAYAHHPALSSHWVTEAKPSYLYTSPTGPFTKYGQSTFAIGRSPAINAPATHTKALTHLHRSLHCRHTYACKVIHQLVHPSASAIPATTKAALSNSSASGHAAPGNAPSEAAAANGTLTHSLRGCKR